MKKDKNYIWLILITLGIIIGCTGFSNLYGSTTDWLCQHTVYPDYFRKLFYETGELLPSFAGNIGAGQNIYHFAYYGFLNQVYMLSYLFPFIKMVDYIMIVSILSVLASVLLCYKWLKKHFETKISFFATILFLCAAPLIFHSHRHLMFVNYMPFLILALIGVERHFEKKNSNFLIFGIFMMIMTSFYYSIGGLLALVIYGISYYLKVTDKVTFKNFMKEAFRFCIPFVLGICLSAVLLLPTAYVILNSRTGLNNPLSIWEVFIPKLNMDALLYSSYSLGLTSIAFISLLFNLIHKKKESRFLSFSLIVVLIFPIFVYLLNGTLYLRSKVLIPLLPLFILQIAEFFHRIENKKVYYIPSFLLLLIVFILIVISEYKDPKFYFDLLFTVGGILAYIMFKKKWLFYTPILLIAFGIGISANLNENYVSKEKYQQIFPSTNQELIENVLKNDTQSWYRMNHYYEVGNTMNMIYNTRYYSTTLYSSTYHNGYKEFFDQEFKNPLPLRNILDEVSTNHGIFNMYMGVKYFVSKDNAPIGYHKITEKDGISVYENPDILPIGYVSSKISSLEEYRQTTYPYNVENLYNTVVVDHDIKTKVEHHIQEISLRYHKKDSNIEMKEKENGYIITANKKEKLILELTEPIKQQFLLIQFDITKVPHCSSGDISITINGQTNKLTCKEWMYFNKNTSFEYVISSNEPIDSLEVEFSKGEFHIENIKTYILDYEYIENRNEEVDAFLIDMEKTKGDYISGTVEVTKDGYFILNVPYDEGFEVKVNGKRVKTEVVNTTFLGFPLTAGTYQIDIIYHAPYQIPGLIISLSSFGIWFFLNHFLNVRKKD